MAVRSLDVETIERDLAVLSHHKAGFERPEALVPRLETVLSLQAVDQVVGAMGDNRAARVIALRTVLRQCVDRIARESTRLMASIYFSPT